jgi:NitT/TauT family transport system ATP-binding protein
MNNTVELQNAGVGFPGAGNRPAYQALKGVNLELREGEFMCLLGPSGCGKTTLLNLVAGFLPPTEGKVVVAGSQVKHPSRDRGVVFQSDRALFDWLTVEENVSFGPRIEGMPRPKWQPKIDELLKLVGLDGHRHKLPRELSGGMKQRVQIARVLANDPRILLMDEPFAALDAYTRAVMQREVVRIWESRRRTVMFVTHDITEAIWLADRIGIMTRGPNSFIREIIDVNLPRPREQMNDDFASLFNRLSAAINAEAATGKQEQ